MRFNAAIISMAKFSKDAIVRVDVGPAIPPQREIRRGNDLDEIHEVVCRLRGNLVVFI